MAQPWSTLPRLAFGGDYNPEQWPAEVRADDVRLMRVAGVNLATVGVFSWALLETAPGRYEFGWLDEVLDDLHEAGVRIDLATATASPPPWLTRAHPEMLPVLADGTTLWQGGRQSYCPSSPIYREHALALCRRMAERYHDHPGLALWHVSNEIGCHNALCYCDTSAAAFRTWLQRRYGDLDALNDAWGTAFWSQHYHDWDEILPPRTAPNFPNPTQRLDFQRFSSDELLDLFRMERDVLHEVSPGVPVTTNFMVMGQIRQLDYFAWGPELDLVSNDHYVRADDPRAHRDVAFCADLTRGTAGGAPWLLMETSTSAVNWQPRNVAKRPGELLRTALSHVARGADGILFFQWRASRAGAEKYHAALVPHAGEDTRVFREVTELGALLGRLREVAGSTSRNRVALLVDWSARWAVELDSHPSADVTYLDQPEAWHAALTALGVGVDVVHPTTDLAAYDLVVVPTLYSVTDEAAAAIAAVVERGGSVVVTYFSGITDEHDHIRLGGYPGAFRDLLGVRGEEFTPLREGEEVRLDEGSSGTVWAEDLALAGAEAVASYVDGPVPGVPAVTRREQGAGRAWYVATRLDEEALARLCERILTEAGVAVTPRRDVEVLHRYGDDRRWTFVLNHSDEAVSLDLDGHDLVADQPVSGSLRVAAGGCAVVRVE